MDDEEEEDDAARVENDGSSSSDASDGGLGGEVGAREARDFFDADADARDEAALVRAMGGASAGKTDAMLSCPGCFALVCALCQRHERFEQYRAVFARNVEVDETSAWRPSDDVKMEGGEGENSACDERYREVTCETCRTVVGVMDEDEVYHFFNVFASAG